MAWLASADLVKTTPFILMLIIAWHRQPFARSRPVVVQGLLGAGLAMALGRLLPPAACGGGQAPAYRCARQLPPPHLRHIQITESA